MIHHGKLCDGLHSVPMLIMMVTGLDSRIWNSGKPGTVYSFLRMIMNTLSPVLQTIIGDSRADPFFLQLEAKTGGTSGDFKREG